MRDERSAEFFDAAARSALAIRRCADCWHWLEPEARTCTSCGGSELNWLDAIGTGELVSWSVVHHPPHPSFAGLVPFAVGQIELAEGPWVEARLTELDLGALRVGLPLCVAFVHPDEGDAFPVFAPDRG
ncbi:Zn-ribbon domain-containing OB-fold protein [Mycolicibacter sinensis]|nr:OB-fold domain-containing protein [Mycolicibacter sinensis]